MSESRGIEIGQKLINLWRRAGLTIRPGATPQAIWSFESRYNVAMPADMRGYYLTVDGMEDELDPGINRFWPLEMLQLVPQEPMSDAHHRCGSSFIFADHCLWCLAWAVQIREEPSDVSGPILQMLGPTTSGREVARSFADFMDSYLLNQFSAL